MRFFKNRFTPKKPIFETCIRGTPPISRTLSLRSENSKKPGNNSTVTSKVFKSSSISRISKYLNSGLEMITL